MFAVQAAGQIGSHQRSQAETKAINREKLRQFDAANQNYLTQVMLDNNKWKNDVLNSEIEQEAVFDSMVQQWNDYDEQLDSIFADADFKLQDAVINMYKNEYANSLIKFEIRLCLDIHLYQNLIKQDHQTLHLY